MCTYHPDASRTQCTHRTHEGHPPKIAESYLQKYPQYCYSEVCRYCGSAAHAHAPGASRVVHGLFLLLLPLLLLPPLLLLGQPANHETGPRATGPVTRLDTAGRLYAENASKMA